ncbi:MAG: flavodoxin family protein [Methanobacteriaceae archaeon]
MMILGISGSPRDGTTEYILKTAMENAKRLIEKRNSIEIGDTKEKKDKIKIKTETFLLSQKTVAPCNHCEYCLNIKNHKDYNNPNIDVSPCIIEDDMLELYDLIKKADGIIIASPVFFGSISAQIKAVIDRCQALIMDDMDVVRGKIGMSAVVGGDRCGGQELAIQQINAFYILNGILPVSGGAFGANLGACFWSQDSVESVKKDEYGFESLNKTINHFIETLNLRESLKNSNNNIL